MVPGFVAQTGGQALQGFGTAAQTGAGMDIATAQALASQRNAEVAAWSQVMSAAIAAAGKSGA